VAASTMEAVNRVRRRWEQDRPAVERTLDRIADLVVQARLALAAGRISELGALMDANHALLETLGVSSPTLDHLATVARRAGALGCKLTGGGLGGCLVALVSDGERDDVAARVLEGGAAQVLPTVLRPSLAAALW